METTTEELQAVEAVEIQPTVAVIGAVLSTEDIAGADLIHLATVYCGESGTWRGVVPKDIREDHLVLVLLQDALLPADNPRWAFMEQRHWRVRMARFKGVPSECVILPLQADERQIWDVGQDVGDQLGVTKYSKPLPAEMQGKAKGNFPVFIPKTDEPNFQRVRDRDEVMGCKWYATVKYDGTSCTAYVKDGQLHVCSRNFDLEDGDNVYAAMARKYDLGAKIPEGYAIQFEIIGPGIQGNPLGLAEHEIRVFTRHCFGEMYRPEMRGRLDYYDFKACMELAQLPMAEVVAAGFGPLTNDELQKLAEIKYPNGRKGEGVVVRGMKNEFSFKVISLLYKESA